MNNDTKRGESATFACNRFAPPLLKRQPVLTLSDALSDLCCTERSTPLTTSSTFLLTSESAPRQRWPTLATRGGVRGAAWRGSAMRGRCELLLGPDERRWRASEPLRMGCCARSWRAGCKRSGSSSSGSGRRATRQVVMERLLLLGRVAWVGHGERETGAT